MSHSRRAVVSIDDICQEQEEKKYQMGIEDGV